MYLLVLRLAGRRCSMYMVSTVWLRLLVEFMRVGAMARFSRHRLINASLYVCMCMYVCI